MDLALLFYAYNVIHFSLKNHRGCSVLFISRLVFYFFIGLVVTCAGGTYPAPAMCATITKTKTLFTIQADFDHPSDVAVGNNGQIYVLDGVNNRVKVHSASGKQLFSFGEAGTGAGTFKFPLGLGVDKEGRIYVADSGNHRVQVFSPEGKFLSQFSTDVSPNMIKPSDPTDVAVNSTLNRCYVVDNDNHHVIIYDLQKMAALKIMGTMGMEKEEFRFPFLIDIDSKGNIYIVEVINTRVQVFDPDGSFISTIGDWGVEKGEFYRPKGVAVDGTGRVLVSDSYLGVIQAFDQEGRLLAIIGDEKGSVKKFKTPTGIFIDKKQRLYVVEMLADRVQIMELQD